MNQWAKMLWATVMVAALAFVAVCCVLEGRGKAQEGPRTCESRPTMVVEVCR